ncbi:hypothetical protein PENSPDRAFT_681681 [Peniophora sp. CONT]|nr:hypothetical protein PENSPDRAFT_681681 [Peniophora sp. CONT]
MESRLSALSQAHTTDLDTLYEENRAMEEMLLKFRSRWKVFAPVSKLPAEILSLIFEVLAFSGVEWFPVTHVCRFWRDTSIEHTALWAHLPATTEKLWDLSVDRACGRPLSVYIRGRLLQHTWLTEALLDDFHLIQTLEIKDDRHTLFPGLPDISSALYRVGRAPLLRRLVIDVDTSTPFLSIQNRFIASVALNLRHAEFYHSPFPWGAGSSSLTRLCVSEVAAKSVNAVCKGLRALPSLEYLVLNIIEFHREEVLSANSSAIMSHLREAHITGSISIVTALVPCLRVPDTAYVEIIIDGNAPNELDDYIGDFASSLNAHECDRLAQSDYTTVKASITSHDVDVQVLTQRGRGLSEANYDPSAGLHLRVSNRMACIGFVYTEVDDLFDELCAGMNKSKWRALEFSGDWSLSWYRSSAAVSATGVETLSFRSIPRVAVESAMLGLDPSLVTEGDPSIMFPDLRSLSLEGISFGCDHTSCERRDAIALSLNMMLEARKNAGHPVSSLALKGCSIAKRDAISCASEVEHFAWDEEVGDAHECYPYSDDGESDSESESEGASENESEIESEASG